MATVSHLCPKIANFPLFLDINFTKPRVFGPFWPPGGKRWPLYGNCLAQLWEAPRFAYFWVAQDDLRQKS
eukprot:5309869-Prorocentrum_lima.AAC.1